MLIQFFYTLRAARLPVSVKEYLTLLEALRAGVLDDDGGPTVDKFYALSRTTLVKDEALFDKFDRAFAAYFKGVELITDQPVDGLRPAYNALRLHPQVKSITLMTHFADADGPGGIKAQLDWFNELTRPFEPEQLSLAV